MSKEQTPITAEEWLDEEYPYILDGFEYLEIDKQVLDVMEQYAQAKVLEFAEWEQSDTSHLNYSPKELVDMFTKQK